MKKSIEQAYEAAWSKLREEHLDIENPTLDDREIFGHGYWSGYNYALANRWTSVEDELPEDGEFVIIYSKNGGIEPSCWNEQYQCWDDADSDDFLYEKNQVTYWLRIPELTLDK